MRLCKLGFPTSGKPPEYLSSLYVIQAFLASPPLPPQPPALLEKKRRGVPGIVSWICINTRNTALALHGIVPSVNNNAAHIPPESLPKIQLMPRSHAAFAYISYVGTIASVV